MKRRWISAVGVMVAGVAGAGWLWCDRGLETAERLAKHELWPDVHAPLVRYLFVHPSNARANLLRAEALVKDSTVPLDARLAGTMAALGRIPDSAPEAAVARVAEGRTRLFLMYEPMAAEERLKRAIELDPRSFDAHAVLWRLYDLTGQPDLVEPHFWAAYDAAPDDRKPLVLRDWYLSQFYPTIANAEVDRLMGFRSWAQQDPQAVEVNRLMRFRLAEPGGAYGHAAMARWFREQGEFAFAVELLDTMAKRMTPAEQAHPYFRGTLIDLLLELGEFERADELFETWSGPTDVREYDLVRGRVMTDIRGDAAEAEAAFARALDGWPGPIDWRTMSRHATSLVRLGRSKEAEVERERIKDTQAAMEEGVLRGVREKLLNLDDTEGLGEVVAFYRRIGREREAECWTRYIASRTAPAAAAQAEAGER